MKTPKNGVFYQHGPPYAVPNRRESGRRLAERRKYNAHKALQRQTGVLLLGLGNVGLLLLTFFTAIHVK
jgi:hypothetical protein